ncbi:fused response regulator/phosphatase [Neptuniibacter halophilus]|uniref:fused response regulator/phosphatase n=1 Tax=Neptuniibacter halophilus TaxID=651666 RepID=UPI0025730018|nr:fused response regulator/phosphatase [Neptuniibacter halophilus]
MKPGEGLKTILLVDDEPVNLGVLAGILQTDYRILVAKSADAAFKSMERGGIPDLILSDIVMPEMDGIDFCRLLKTDPRYRDIPLLFVTSHDDLDNEARAYAAGGVDFITKPISPPRVKLRVSLHLQLEQNRQRVLHQKQQLEQEQEDVARILDKMRTRYPLNSARLSYRMSPVERSSGDILLSAENASGEYYLLGDFTGHGLTAAVGAPVLARLFTESVTEKQMPPEALLQEINAELCNLMPTGMFVSAGLAHFCREKRQLKVWNAGLPIQYLCNAEITPIHSSLPPLGIMPVLSSQAPSYSGSVMHKAELFLYTDGLTESVNRSGEMFGDERLVNLLQQGTKQVESIYSEVLAFCQPDSPSDDLTMVAIDL